MKKTDITIEVTKDGNGLYYGRLPRDDNGRVYAKMRGPLGMTYTPIDALERTGHTVRIVEKGGEKNGSKPNRKALPRHG